MKIQLLLIVALLVGCSKEQGYTLKKYKYKVSGGGVYCDAILKIGEKRIDLNTVRSYEFESRTSFEVIFTPEPASRWYSYGLTVERQGVWHQQETWDSSQDGYHGQKTYIVK